MQLRGGMAGINSVSFISDHYSATTVNEKNSSIVYIMETENTPRFIQALKQWPFIRAYALFIHMFIVKKQLALIMLLLFGILTMLNAALDDTTVNSVLHSVSIHPLLFCAMVVGSAGILIRFTPIGKYHAAEHMAANAYEHSGDMKLENVKRHSRVHSHCGTNIVMIFFVTFTLLYGIFGYNPGTIFLAWGIAYELKENEERIPYLMRPLMYLGYATQYVLFTSKPKDKHVEAAIKTISSLEKEENSYVQQLG
ncbi:DUF1385 domain-containing protein [Salibacterium aidingense]|uniref:DUF1385 domain-containing protein n=1 Tax=Salibacterium aidingense TaxID=384933 RepID=UPI00040F7A7A|nr:DUF1385 domain-containing protein [Salibacterium aidingense]